MSLSSELDRVKSLTDFTLQHWHIKLLSNFNIGWNLDEWGAPEVDPKRPFGNGDLWKDIARILEFDLFEDAYGEKHLSANQLASIEQIYAETLVALRIVLQHGSFERGVFHRQNSWSDRWIRLG